MLGKHRQIRTQLHWGMDACLACLALWMGHYIRWTWNWNNAILEPFDTLIWLWLVLLPLTPFVLMTQGFYNRPLLSSRWEMFWPLFKGSIILTVVVIIAIYLDRGQLARFVPPFFGGACFALIFAKEELLRLLYKTRMGQAEFQKRVILVGTAEETAKMQERMLLNSRDTLTVVAELDLNRQNVNDLVNQLHESAANSVIFNARHTVFGEIEKAIQACELEGVEAWLVADFFKVQVSRTSLDDFYGLPMLVFQSTPETSWQAIGKLLIDKIGALVLLVPFTLVLLPVAFVLIKLSSPGPIFFRQKRCGLNGQPFVMFKFRTMVTDAEQHQHELAAMNEMNGPVFKVTEDPRITKVGKILRKFSFDEFPQLINVLRGDMSLVGPRPLPVDEVRRFDDLAHRRRLSVKPGLTCLWQISGRNEVKDFKDWVRLDLEYIDNWSLWLDIKILWRTIPVVLLGLGENRRASSSANGSGREFTRYSFVAYVCQNPCQSKKRNAGPKPGRFPWSRAARVFSARTWWNLLLARGHRVIVDGQPRHRRVDNIAHLAGNADFRFIQQDVTEFLFLNEPVDYVWHFASPASPVDYLELPIQTLKVGSLGTHKALGLALNKGGAIPAGLDF